MSETDPKKPAGKPKTTVKIKVKPMTNIKACDITNLRGTAVEATMQKIPGSHARRVLREGF